MCLAFCHYITISPNNRITLARWFEKYKESDFSRSGCTATKTVILPSGKNQ